MSPVPDYVDNALAQAFALGWPAVLTNPGTDGEEHQVMTNELPSGLVQRLMGRDDVRVMDVEFRRSQLARIPEVDATVDVDGGPQAGQWFILGTERQDDLVVVSRARRSKRADAVAAGVKEYRR